jgi:hypothetical protein
LSATTDNAGKVAFFADGKKIPNCVNINASVGTVTCNWKPAVQKVVKVYSSLSINGTVAATSDVILISVTRRTGTR